MAPIKRQRQSKMTTQALLEFDLGESSSDSDFCIDDYDTENSKDDEDDDDDGNSTSATPSTTSSSSDNDDENKDKNAVNVNNNDHISEDSTQQLKQLLAENADTSHPPETTAAKTIANQQHKQQEHSCNDNDLAKVLKEINNRSDYISKITLKPICGVCLGDRSDDSNEIVDCDGCGVSVHEGCYGVSDNSSISSTNSTCSTEPWFCEACRADVQEPTCELCPNKGGIYKETDVGKWVHLVCALYVPGVAFGEVDQLSSVTLFEMQYSKWGSKTCSLCENSRFARTGVCIGCDAGMCKTYFHVTCAQAAGLLTEAHHEEADVADPFYAHCKVHSEKELIKKRKRNYCILQQNIAQKLEEKKLLKMEDPCPAQMRIQRKLLKYQNKYAEHKKARPPPWVPTQKMPRVLTTSASACHRLSNKADVMSIDVKLVESQEAQVAALTDIRKKWHVAPAFSVEFVAYYLDRINRIKELKSQLNKMIEENHSLSEEQDTLRNDYDERLQQNRDLTATHKCLTDSIKELQKHITTLCPNKTLQHPTSIGCPAQVMVPNESITRLNKSGVSVAMTMATANTPATISVPTAAALKMGVGFPLAHLGPRGSKVDSTRLLSTHVKNSPTNSNATALISVANLMGTNLLTTPSISATSICGATVNTPHTLTNSSNVTEVPTYECGICKKLTDQHLLAKCDTCQLHYHLGCLNPPLTRHPKKSKLYGWQCSECDKSDESDILTDMPKGPRKSRTRFNKDGIIVPVEKDEKINQTNGNSYLRRRCSIDMTSQHNATATTKKSSTQNKNVPVATTGPTPPVTSPASNLKRHAPNEGHKELRMNKKPKLNKSTNSNINGVPRTSPEHVASICVENVLQQHNEEIILNTGTTMPNTLRTIQNEIEQDPLALPNNINSTQLVNDNNKPPSSPQIRKILLQEINQDNTKQSRKQKRKERHKNKHNNLMSDTEKSINKEHKRKRKKNRRDSEAPHEDLAANIPKIKIKFKTLPLPGEVTPEAQFFYVPANMVRSAGEASRPTSVETIDDTMPSPNISPAFISTTPTKIVPADANENILINKQSVATPTTSARPRSATATTPTINKNNITTTTTTTSPTTIIPTIKNVTLMPRKSSPRKLATILQQNNRTATGRKPKNNATNANSNKVLLCCICQITGTNANVVTCDECRRHYHFTCLDPPLKKSPKIRGYSWHCADCDPTEDEKI